jgi:hypothetical protein
VSAVLNCLPRLGGMMANRRLGKFVLAAERSLAMKIARKLVQEFEGTDGYPLV